MMNEYQPSTTTQLADIVRAAAADGRKLMIRGGGSKAEIGAPVESADVLDMRGISGVVDYDPAELVLTVRSGTPLAEIETLLFERNQQLMFEPFDHGPIFGHAAGAATIGGIIAAGVSGSRRLSGGALRDHLLGFTAVSGRGETFTAGAKVVKNVTGFDVPKIMAGSWGRLAAMTEVTLKVLPAPRISVTRIFRGLTPSQAYEAMSHALGSGAGISAAAHAPDAVGGDTAITALRLEGFGPSVAARIDLLDALFEGTHCLSAFTDVEAEKYWTGFRTLSLLNDELPLWRVSVPPRGCIAVIAALEPQGAQWMLDWAGGLVWLAFDGSAEVVRTVASQAGGHAMLIRADVALRAQVPTFHPPMSVLSDLEARVRRSFDPTGVFETGRFDKVSHAN
jgi:glycolate oxidase FAD binding subunit